MDFFEAQERAKRKTTRLVVLFGLAVAGIIVAGYFAVVVALPYATERAMDGYRPRESYWQPDVLAMVSGVTIAIVGLSSLFKWFTFRKGGRAVAEMIGARQINPASTQPLERRLLNVVEEMAIASGMPLPAVYVMDGEPGINAFAAGLTTSDAVVAVTQGTLEKLGRDELQGVVAHEFSHILNGDMRLNVKLTAIVFGILVIGLIGRGIMTSLRFSRPRRDSKNGGATVAILAAGLVLLALGYIGYFFGRLIQAAVSRQREYLADAAAVQFTRNPSGITGALRKIGGYSLGSSLLSNRSTEIGHFFFAQGFRSRLGGLWATHPPLPERIKAIDASFDGTYFNPPTVVDVENEPWSKVTGQPPIVRRDPVVPPAAAAIISSIGTLPETAAEDARALLQALPTPLHDAVHDAGDAPLVLFLLLLDADGAVRARQMEFVAKQTGAHGLARLEALSEAARSLKAEQRLPVAQLALGAMRNLTPAALSPILGLLDELVHADSAVSTYEYALQKMIVHHLRLAQNPNRGGHGGIHSFNALSHEIALVLSTLAYLADEQPRRAFETGASHLKLVEGGLEILPRSDCTLTRLDAALDRLTQASGPIKKRVLLAAAAATTADGKLHPREGELLRAISAVLDCPMPPMVPNQPAA